MNTFTDTYTFKQQLNKFILDNNIIGTTTGVGVGLATKDVILSFISDIIFPVFYLLAAKFNIPYINNNNSKKQIIHYATFLKQFITWLVILIITFIFVQISFKIFLGVDNSKKEEKKEEEQKYK
jgi:large-conductance mechanosensitive channel